ncbi:protein TolQ [Novispirillum itersonii]|uniref:protein TolQ n=1 Tax=Novispirillum itersonii TaxID=189 RepID=UPI000365F796|nr:protein TolQ [Novispirillum itersonii]
MDASSLPAASHDLSMIGLFLQADIIVKMVMLSLVGASVWSWAIIIDKVMKMRRVVTLADDFEERFWSGGSLEDLFERIGNRPLDPMSAVFVAAMREWRRSSGRNNAGDVTMRVRLAQRLERVMHITVTREMEGLEKRVGFLASTGSVAPFIGLFGTVWGIMNSFAAIGASKDTSLATVAPGIAEALFATAIGLVAAIPAVLAYNKISSDMDRFAQRLENFAGEFGAILSRQLDERG